MTSPRISSAASKGGRRIFIYALVAFLHVILIFAPLWISGISLKKKNKEDMFRVKIGGRELSAGPMVGMPERVPPRPPAAEPGLSAPPKKTPSEPRIPTVSPKPAPKPVSKAVPKKRPPVKKKVVKPKVKPRPKPKIPAEKKVVKPKVKPRPEPKLPPEKKVVKPKVKPRPEPKLPPKKKVVKPQAKKTPVRRNPMDDVYRAPASPNLNPKVPVGQNNRAQKYASKADNKAPGGGKKVDDAAWAAYGKNLERYIYSRWTEPPQSLLRGELPETVIEVTIEANGRVSNSRVVRASGNRAMESSVQVLLSNLDLLPRPPEGRITFRITLKTR